MGKKIEVSIKKNKNIDLNINDTHQVNLLLDVNKGAGTSNYNVLTNKPQINYITLQGNKMGEELNLQDKMNEITEQEIDNIIFG